MEPKHPQEHRTFFGWKWDVAAAWRLIEESRPVSLVPLEVVDQYHAMWVGKIEPERWEPQPDGSMKLKGGNLMGIDPEKALTDEVDLSVPTLWIPFNNALILIDGWHRLHKAHIARQPLLAYRLTAEEAKEIEL